jgi:hypothetical protein
LAEPSGTPQPTDSEPILRTWPATLLPALVVLVLSWPCFHFTYLFDDFDFLQRAQTFRLDYLLPDVHSLFYRPISRELYFAVLGLIGMDHPMVGHVLNYLVLAVAVGLVVVFSSRLLGSRGGQMAGVLFASLGSVPLLVGWVSGIQDLLAITFILAALILQLIRRPMLAALATAAAILSKETAVAVIPVLVFLDLILGRRSDRPLARAWPYALLLVSWALLHPGLHILAARGFQGGSAGYLGLDNPTQPQSFLHTLLALANVPAGKPSPPWVSHQIPFLVLASVAAFLSLKNSSAADSRSNESELPSKRRVLILAALLVIPPVLLTAALVKYWAPYYSCLPAIGSSILIAVLLRNQPLRRVTPIVLCFLALGVFARGAELDPSITTERNLERTSDALERVEMGFKRLYPSLTRGSNVYVSTQTHGSGSVYTHMYRFQALRVWYRDPSLVTTKPNRRRPGAQAEYLFWIGTNLDVAEIDPVTLRVRSSGATKPQYFQYQKTLRAYALGLAGSGQYERGAEILLRMPQVSEAIWGLDARIAATLLIGSGKLEMARAILARVPPMNREDALEALSGVLAEATPGLNLDEAALAAFGIETKDPAAMRQLMEWFHAKGYKDAAMRFAVRLNRILPDDPEARGVIRELTSEQERDRVTPHEDADSF